MRLGTDRGNDNAKERKLSAAIYRAAQSGALTFTLLLRGCIRICSRSSGTGTNSSACLRASGL